MFDSNANRIRSPVWKSLAGSTSPGASLTPACINRKRRPGATFASSSLNISFAFNSRATAVGSAGFGAEGIAVGEAEGFAASFDTAANAGAGLFGGGVGLVGVAGAGAGGSALDAGAAAALAAGAAGVSARRDGAAISSATTTAAATVPPAHHI